MAHGNQGTGNWKKNRDSHEKKRAGGEKAKSRSSWVDMGKKTNSNRNKSRKGGGGKSLIDIIFGK